MTPLLIAETLEAMSGSHIAHLASRTSIQKVCLVLTAVFVLSAVLVGCQNASAIEGNEASAANAPAQAAGTATDLVGFQPTNDYKLLVGDVLDPDAQFMISNAAGAVLVLTTKLPTSVALMTRSQEVAKVDISRVQQQTNGTSTVPSGAQLGVLTKFIPNDKGVMFSYEGTMAKVELDLPEPLVGDHKPTDLYEHNPAYRVKANNYTPDESVVAELKGYKKQAQVQVVFGSWCHVCSEYLPNLMRVAEEIEGSKIDFKYLGIPDWDYPDVKRLKVTSLPTAIVYVEGTEVGRFDGAAGFRGVEKVLLDNLNKSR